MGVIIRDVDLTRDPDQIVELYRRFGYGAAVGNAVPLTGADFVRMMRLNVMRVMLVAEDKGRIVGVLGGVAIDACRAAPAGSLWGNHLVIEATARGGIIMGQLFSEIFDRLVDLGIGTLYARVNPKNRMAMRLDVRAGYRNIGSNRPDEDSFVELISHLPGTMAAARVVARDPDTGEVWLPKFTLSSIRAGRGQDMGAGVRRGAEGVAEQCYHFEAKGLSSDVVFDGETGRIIELVANGRDYTADFVSTMEVRPDTNKAALAARVVALAPRAVGPFTVTTDELGRLRVDHPDHIGPVVLDCFPDGEGHTVAFRRPLALNLTVADGPQGWTLRDDRGTERIVGFDGDTITVDCRVADPAAIDQLAVHPWVGLRTAEYAVSAPGARSWNEPLRPGRWPPQLPAYETAGEADWSVPAAGAVSRWTDETAGLAVTIDWLDAGLLRCEGECRADGARLRYRIRPSARERVVVAPAPDRVDPVACPVGAWSDVVWGRHSLRRFANGERDTEITVSRISGLVDWRHHGRTVLKSGSGERGFGAMATVPSALWPSLNTDRSDIDRGPEWASLDDRFVFVDAGQAPPDPAAATWSIGTSADLGHIRLVTDVPATYAGLDAVFNLKPSSEITTLLMADSAGRFIEVACRDAIERPWGLWWGFTRRVIMPLDGDRALEFSALTANHGEILVRSVTAGFILGLMSRVGPAGRSVAEWSVRLIPNPNQSSR